MSVYIKNMTMPENCRVCRFYNSPTNTDYRMYAWCNVDGKTRDAYAMQDCPLIPVLPHGRLIDADAVERNLIKMQMAQKGVVGHGIRKSRAVVRDMATVIPADESNMDSFIHIFKEDDEEDGMDSFIRILKD